jgi:hypothetical protein
MRWRTLRIIFLLFQALWLNVIVPGHQRGVVALPGESCAACERSEKSPSECCDMTVGGKREDAGPKGESAPKGDPALHCAICFFAARVTPPDYVDLTPPPLKYSHQIPVPRAEIRTSIALVPTYDGRGPPAIS